MFCFSLQVCVDPTVRFAHIGIFSAPLTETCPLLSVGHTWVTSEARHLIGLLCVLSSCQATGETHQGSALRNGSNFPVFCRTEADSPLLSSSVSSWLEMFRFCTSSLLLLVLLGGAQRGAAEQCDSGGDEFVSGSENFVLDAKDAVEDGADLLDTQVVSVGEECETLCCQDSRCNLALLEPRDGEEEDTRNCFLFNCVHKNRFVCQFVNQDGYKSYIRRSMYRRYLEAPGEGANTNQYPINSNKSPERKIQQKYWSRSDFFKFSYFVNQ